MDKELHQYRITSYIEWEALQVEASCRDDEHAIAKARRHGSLRHVGTNFPAVIFSHVISLEPGEGRVVGTWEYRLKGEGKPGYTWHDGDWPARPEPTDRQALRAWVVDS